MDSDKKPRLIHLVIAIESVVLLAFLLMLTPVGGRLTLSERVESAENVEAEDGAPESGEAEKQEKAGGGNAEEAESAGKEEKDSFDQLKGKEDSGQPEADAGADGQQDSEQKDYIKWVDFDIPAEALKKAFRCDIDTYLADIHLNWIEILAYLGARYGGDFSRYKESDMDAVAERLLAGEKMADIASAMEYYPYYLEAYTAVLGGMVGMYQVEIPGSEAPEFALPKDEKGNPVPTEGNVWVTKYGLKAFSPIAKNYPYTDYDDFGDTRDYGFHRVHLGHDLMGQVGTPVIAVESGRVEAIGWNRYGGWRLGIRSLDGRRYYYYAHLRKNYPYHKSLQEGGIVQAGDVIGYLGRTGYSSTENTNNIEDPHLHFGIQLIFDESQKDSDHEIWIDCYELIKFLSINRAETVKDESTKEYYRVYQMKDPAIPGGAAEQRMPEYAAAP